MGEGKDDEERLPRFRAHTGIRGIFEQTSFAEVLRHCQPGESPSRVLMGCPVKEGPAIFRHDVGNPPEPGLRGAGGEVGGGMCEVRVRSRLGRAKRVHGCA
jgi:hypothetical protein